MFFYFINNNIYKYTFCGDPHTRALNSQSGRLWKQLSVEESEV